MMKNCWILLFTLLFASNLVQAQTTTEPKSMSHAFDSMLQSLLAHSVEETKVEEAPTAEKVIFLDARAKAEYEVSHIPKAKWVGFLNFQKKEVKKIAKDQAIIVYCSVGYRSEKITEKLIAMGFTNVSNLYGGIFEWKNQGKTVTNNSGEITEKVHTYNEDWGQWLLLGEKVH